MDRDSLYKYLKIHVNGTFTGKELPDDIDSKYIHQLTRTGDVLAVYYPDDIFEVSNEGKDFIKQYEREYRPIIANEIMAVIAFVALIVTILTFLR